MPTGKPLNDSQSAPDLEIVGDQVTIHPSGFTGGPAIQDAPITERNLVSHMVRFRASPIDFLREVSLYMSGTGWRAYDDIIGQPIFYNGFSDRMKSLILANPLLQSKVKELADARLAVEEKDGLLNAMDGTDGTLDKKKKKRKSEIEGNLTDVVDTMMDNMICKMESKRFIRGAYYLCTQLLTRAYHQGTQLGIYRRLTSADFVRYSCLERGSLSPTVRGGGSCQEETVHHFPPLPQVACGLCFPSAHMLPSGNRPTRRCGG